MLPYSKNVPFENMTDTSEPTVKHQSEGPRNTPQTFLVEQSIKEYIFLYLVSYALLGTFKRAELLYEAANLEVSMKVK